MSPETGSGAGGAGTDRLAPLRAEPARAAILTDIDGTLAPIVDRPDKAAVPKAAREALIALSGRFGLVGCVSGRQAEEAKRLVGVEEIAYAGNHGLELLLPGEDGPQLDPSVRDRERAAAEFIAAHSETVVAAGLRIEDKGPIQALHWRGADDERAAEARARELAAEGGQLRFVPIRQTTSCSSSALFALAVALQRRYLLGSRFFARSKVLGLRCRRRGRNRNRTTGANPARALPPRASRAPASSHSSLAISA